jgi:4'-phosphopantetheinyl transferase EntD
MCKENCKCCSGAKADAAAKPAERRPDEVLADVLRLKAEYQSAKSVADAALQARDRLYRDYTNAKGELDRLILK